MTLPKRTIEEWLTVARVARPQRIVFTEGKSDAAALFLASGLLETTDFRTADEIDHDPETTNFVGGNKARVRDLLFGVREFNQDKVGSDRIENLRGLVDSDYAFIAGEAHIAADEILVATQFANLFAGAVIFETVRDAIYAGHGYLFSAEVWDVTIEALRFCFAARYHNAREALNVAAPKIGDHMSRQGNSITFNESTYLQAYFGVQGLPCDELKAAVVAYYDVAEDVRHYVHSSDFFNATYAIVRTFRGAGGGLSEANIRSTLLASISLPACDQGGAQEIVQWSIAA